MSRLAALRGRYSKLAEPLRSERRLELALLVLAALLTLQLLWLGAAALRELRVSPVVPSADSLRVADMQAFPAIRAEESLALKARPLFWPSRRPSAVDQSLDAVLASGADSDARPAPGLKALTISGIYGNGSEGGAIVQYRGERRRVAVGAELDGWELESIAPNTAVFVSAGVRDTYRLLEQRIPAEGEAVPVSARVPTSELPSAPRSDVLVAGGAPPKAKN